MKAAGVVLTCVVITAGLSGYSLPVGERDQVPARAPNVQPATLEYKVTGKSLTRVHLVEVDENPVDTEGVKRREYLFKLAPGKHRVRFRGEEGFPVHPEVVEFEAAAGKRYVPGFERVNHKETDGNATTLYFNFVSPKILDEHSVKVAEAASAPFKTGSDAQKYVLLYEDTTVPVERTARVRCGGASTSQPFFIASISGRAGELRLEYVRSWFDLGQYYRMLPGSWSDPWQLRLLPGEYRFDLTIEHLWYESRSGTPVRGPVKSITLHAEAGHTYQVNPNLEWVGKVDEKTWYGLKTTSFYRWSPTFEDITEKGPVDKRSEASGGPNRAAWRMSALSCASSRTATWPTARSTATCRS